MNSPNEVSLALLNIGGAEIILILAALLILATVALGFAGLIYLIARAVVNRPPLAPPTLPPQVVSQNQSQRDREHLNLLSIFHFVFAGFAFLGMGFLAVHYTIMHTVFSNPGVWKAQNAGPPPQVFLNAFVWFYLFMGIILVTVLVLNVLSGVFLRQRTNRGFSMVVAGINCVQIPFGTALGVFTLIVLSRESVRQLYLDRTQSCPTSKGAPI